MAITSQKEHSSLICQQNDIHFIEKGRVYINSQWTDHEQSKQMKG